MFSSYWLLLIIVEVLLLKHAYTGGQTLLDHTLLLLNHSLSSFPLYLNTLILEMPTQCDINVC